MTTSMQTAIRNFDLGPAEAFVDPDTAADYLQTTRRHVLEMVREGLIPGHPLDHHAKKKDWRFLLSELHAYMLSCDQRPPEACKPPRRV
jgi:excisionase family DNA binding protein